MSRISKETTYSYTFAGEILVQVLLNWLFTNTRKPHTTPVLSKLGDA